MTVTICALLWSHPGLDEVVHSNLTASLRTTARFGGTPISRFRRKDGSIGPLEILTIRWKSQEALERYRANSDAAEVIAYGSNTISNLVIGYEEFLKTSQSQHQAAQHAPSECPGTPVTVCVLAWSHAGQDLLLSAYADRALANVDSFGGRVIQRLRRLPGSPGPLETQIIEFPNDELLAGYREAQRVDEYSQIRDTAIANVLVIRVESMLELAQPML